MEDCNKLNLEITLEEHCELISSLSSPMILPFSPMSDVTAQIGLNRREKIRKTILKKLDDSITNYSKSI